MTKRAILFLISCLIVTHSAFAANGFWSHHKILFIFSSQCPHCQKMGPVMKQWLANTRVPFEGMSVDGQGLPSIPTFSYPSQDLLQVAFPGGQVVYPASFVVNTRTNQLFPIGIGAMGYGEFDSRVNALLLKVIAHEGVRHAD